MRRCVPEAAVSRCSDMRVQKPGLLDHLVGEREKLIRNGHTKLLRGLDVDDQVEFGRLHDRQVAGPFSLEYPTDVYPDELPSLQSARVA